MANVTRIAERIRESGFKMLFIAKQLEITRVTLKNKMDGKTEWSVKEANCLANLLNLSQEEFFDLFFAQEDKK